MAYAFEDHDHGICAEQSKTDLAKYCKEHDLRLTPVRLKVLEILLQNHKAMGAYDILEILREEGLGSQPPIVYRALDFLVMQGFAHKIEGLNAFVACAHPLRDHAPAFMVCTACSRVAEAEAPTMNEPALEAGFEIKHTVVEALGLCPDCSAENE